jgi:hypothetical protein
MSASTLAEIASSMPAARKGRSWSLSWIPPTGPGTILGRVDLPIITTKSALKNPHIHYESMGYVKIKGIESLGKGVF